MVKNLNLKSIKIKFETSENINLVLIIITNFIVNYDKNETNAFSTTNLYLQRLKKLERRLGIDRWLSLPNVTKCYLETQPNFIFSKYTSKCFFES